MYERNKSPAYQVGDQQARRRLDAQRLKRVGSVVADKRRSLDVELADLAAAVGLSAEGLRLIEAGLVDVSLSQLARLAESLGSTLEVIVDQAAR